MQKIDIDLPKSIPNTGSLIKPNILKFDSNETEGFIKRKEKEDDFLPGHKDLKQAKYFFHLVKHVNLQSFLSQIELQ